MRWDAPYCPPPGPGSRQAQPLRFTAGVSGGSILSPPAPPDRGTVGHIPPLGGARGTEEWFSPWS